MSFQKSQTVGLIMTLILLSSCAPISPEEQEKKLAATISQEAEDIDSNTLLEQSAGKWYMPLNINFNNNSNGLVTDEKINNQLQVFLTEKFVTKEAGRVFIGKRVFYLPENGVGQFKQRVFYWDNQKNQSGFIDAVGEERNSTSPWLVKDDSLGDKGTLIWNGPVRPKVTILHYQGMEEKYFQRKGRGTKCKLDQACLRFPRLRFYRSKKQDESDQSHDLQAAGAIAETKKLFITIDVDFTIEFKQVKDIHAVSITPTGELREGDINKSDTTDDGKKDEAPPKDQPEDQKEPVESSEDTSSETEVEQKKKPVKKEVKGNMQKALDWAKSWF